MFYIMPEKDQAQLKVLCVHQAIQVFHSLMRNIKSLKMTLILSTGLERYL